MGFGFCGLMTFKVEKETVGQGSSLKKTSWMAENLTKSIILLSVAPWKQKLSSPQWEKVLPGL